MQRLLFILLFAGWGLTATAGTGVQKPPIKKTVIKRIPQKVKYNTAAIKIRQFDQAGLDRYLDDKAFSYSDQIKAKKPSAWGRFWAAFWRFIENLFRPKNAPAGKVPTWPSYLQYVFYAALLAGLVFVIIKFLGGDLANIFSKKPKAISMPYSESLENIHEITFDEEIENALNQRNYRLAIRLLYLSCLKQLNDAQLIHWQIEKTNANYLSELTDDDQRQSFAVLTRQFEYAWYGDFPVDGQSYQNINVLFADFKKMLP